MKRAAGRWRTTFGSWVGSVGVTRVVIDLRASGHPVTPGAVYHWVAGRAIPTLPLAGALVRLSEGRVSLDDILQHRREAVDAGSGGRDHR
jgi:hypothetical protein